MILEFRKDPIPYKEIPYKDRRWLRKNFPKTPDDKQSTKEWWNGLAIHEQWDILFK